MFFRAASASLVLLVLCSCVTPGEQRGDEAAARGDTPAAIKHYDDALAEVPIMDFEWERIRDKRKVLVEGEWGPRLDALSGPGDTRDALEHCHRLLTFRRESRDAATSSSLARRTDELIARECTAPRLLAVVAADVNVATEQLLTLEAHASKTIAPQPVFDALSEALGAVLAKPLPASSRAGPVEDLKAVLALRKRVRAAHFPAKVDALLDAQLEAAARRPLAAPSPKDAPDRYLALLDLRAESRALGAPAPTLQFLDRVVGEAFAQVLVLIDEKVAARRYLEAVDLLSSLTARSERAHPSRARLQALIDEAAAYHAGQATALPSGYRQVLERSLASAFSEAHRPGLKAQRAALAPGWATDLELVPTAAEGPCAAAAALVAGALASSGRTKLPVSLRLSGCQADERDERLERTAKYEVIEKYIVQERQQVGTQRVQVQVGTQQVQCSKPSSLDGYVWQGLCSVPVYETRTEPVFAMVNVEKERTVLRELPYAVLRRTVSARVSGVASFTWEDGTRFDVALEARSQNTEEAWSYDLPGKRAGERPTHEERRFSGDLNAASYLRHATSNAAAGARRDIAARIRAHRAQRARDEGTRALAAGDQAEATEAFVRSVLHDGKAEGDAARWLEGQLGANAARITSLLSEQGLAVTVPAASVEAVAAVPYEEQGRVAAEDSFMKSVKNLEKDLSTPTTENYKAGIRMPNEIVGVHFGLAPWDLQTGTQLGQRVAANAAIEIQYHFLEMLGLTYGLVVHDQATVRVSLGFLTAPRREYANGDKETGLSFTIDASYALHVGLRFHYVAFFAGVQAGYQHAAGGESWAYGFHVEPSARLTLRLFRTQQLILEATGFVPFIPGVARKDRLTVAFPLSFINKDTYAKLMVERAGFQGSQLADDGQTRESLGTVTSSTAALLLGFRF